jgi:hypothetical protein
MAGINARANQAQSKDGKATGRGVTQRGIVSLS